MYRPPNLSTVDSILIWQELSRACRYDQLCVLGDFNVRNIDWDLTVGDIDFFCSYFLFLNCRLNP